MSVRLWPELARARSATYIEPTESASVSQRGARCTFRVDPLDTTATGETGRDEFISRLLALLSNHYTYSIAIIRNALTIATRSSPLDR